MKTILECNKRNLHTFTIYEIEKQYNFMMDKIQYGERIYNFPVFFANGLKDVIEQSRSNKIYQEDKIREYELAMQRKKENQIIYYNWLEEN